MQDRIRSNRDWLPLDARSEPPFDYVAKLLVMVRFEIKPGWGAPTSLAVVTLKHDRT